MPAVAAVPVQAALPQWPAEQLPPSQGSPEPVYGPHDVEPCEPSPPRISHAGRVLADGLPSQDGHAPGQPASSRPGSSTQGAWSTLLRGASGSQCGQLASGHPPSQQAVPDAGHAAGLGAWGAPHENGGLHSADATAPVGSGVEQGRGRTGQEAAGKSPTAGKSPRKRVPRGPGVGQVHVERLKLGNGREPSRLASGSHVPHDARGEHPEEAAAAAQAPDQATAVAVQLPQDGRLPELHASSPELEELLPVRRLLQTAGQPCSEQDVREYCQRMVDLFDHVRHHHSSFSDDWHSVGGFCTAFLLQP